MEAALKKGLQMKMQVEFDKMMKNANGSVNVSELKKCDVAKKILGSNANEVCRFVNLFYFFKLIFFRRNGSSFSPNTISIKTDN